MAFPDDLAFSRRGKYLYITDMSSTYAIDSLLYSALSGECDGRLLRLNMATKKLSTVVGGLCSANGVEVTNDGDFILISETMRSRVRMVETSTFKTRKLIYLPASPDNIRRNSKGTYWVGASHPRTAAADFIRRHRFLRQLIGGFISLKNIAKTINKKSNMVFEVDRMGKVLQTLHDANGTLTNGLAQAVELSDGRLALTTYSANFVAILNENDSKPIGDVKHV
uniref:Strictosidine synthase conserved region domain-containing protein n=1 Tax=Ciona savignyi TaxID=51511 RepID=H2Z939_CIOSA